MKNGFFRGHGLGNDYVVMDPRELAFSLTPSRVKSICDRNWGLGSDGILVLVPSKRADFGLRIFNPDGSEAEKSGNGLRIFARYLHATGKTKRTHFTVETKGGLVTIALHVDQHGDASAVTVEMGRATFQPAALPCTLTTSELIDRPIDVAGQSLIFTGVSVGNPHCVVFKPSGQSWSREDLLRLGPALENHALFPTRSADRPEGTLYLDLGARGRRNPGFRVLLLRCRECSSPARVGEKSRDSEDAGRHAQYQGCRRLQPHHERSGRRSRARKPQPLLCA
jgi:diaminopimelate epimerase